MLNLRLVRMNNKLCLKLVKLVQTCQTLNQKVGKFIPCAIILIKKLADFTYLQVRWRLLSINFLKELDGFKWIMDCSSVLSVPEHSSINAPQKGITVKNTLSRLKVMSVLIVGKNILIYVTLRCTCLITVGFWCQTIHKKFLRRFDTSFDIKMMMKIYAIEIVKP